MSGPSSPREELEKNACSGGKESFATTKKSTACIMAKKKKGKGVLKWDGDRVRATGERRVEELLNETRGGGAA